MLRPRTKEIMIWTHKRCWY